MTVRWAVAGTGMISRSFVPDLRSVPGAEVAAVFGRDRSRAGAFGAEYGVAAVFDDYHELLADPTIDAVRDAPPPGARRARGGQACARREADGAYRRGGGRAVRARGRVRAVSHGGDVDEVQPGLPGGAAAGRRGADRRAAQRPRRLR